MAKTMITARHLQAIAMLPEVLKAAQLLAAVGVIKPEDVNKCVRVYVKKNPEVNEVLVAQGRDIERELQQHG